MEATPIPLIRGRGVSPTRTWPCTYFCAHIIFGDKGVLLGYMYISQEVGLAEVSWEVGGSILINVFSIFWAGDKKEPPLS